MVDPSRRREQTHDCQKNWDFLFQKVCPTLTSLFQNINFYPNLFPAP
jgi:enterochelin esterase-like enzyme